MRCVFSGFACPRAAFELKLLDFSVAGRRPLEKSSAPVPCICGGSPMSGGRFRDISFCVAVPDFVRVDTSSRPNANSWICPALRPLLQFRATACISGILETSSAKKRGSNRLTTAYIASEPGGGQAAAK